MSRENLKKIGELFCGAGGFAEGAKLAGFEHLWGTDYDTDSCISFEKNQKTQTYCMDVRKFTNKKLMKQVLDDHGKINGLLFGFPCNDFSLANKQVGKRLIRKFEYYFNLRMSLLKSALRGVGNLSNRNVYDIPNDAKRVIESKLREWSKEFVYDKWNKSSKKAEKLNKPESLYDQYFKK